MAAQQSTPMEAYTCPDCGGTVVFDRGWACTDCRHVPRSGAD